MNLSKTTINYARSRGMDFSDFTDDENPHDIRIAVYAIENDDEPDFIIGQNEDSDQFFLRTNMYLKESIWEELPYWILSEAHLRRVLDFIFKSMK